MNTKDLFLVIAVLSIIGITDVTPEDRDAMQTAMRDMEEVGN